MPNDLQSLVLQQRLLIASQRVLIKELKGALKAYHNGEVMSADVTSKLLQTDAEDETQELLADIEKVRNPTARMQRFVAVMRSGN